MNPELSNERRQHIVYVTKNSEYHCRAEECVGVRDRSTGLWHKYHPALRGRLLGGMEQGAQLRRIPTIGSRLVFSGIESIMTSQVLRAGRPPKDSLEEYTSLSISGEIESPT